MKGGSDTDENAWAGADKALEKLIKALEDLAVELRRRSEDLSRERREDP